MSCLRLALFGHPVAHSRSRELFESLQQAGGPRVEYELVDVLPEGACPEPAEGLASKLDELRAGRWDGANVTVPHKVAVAGLVDRLGVLAGKAGGVNVIVRESSGGLVGENTDGTGFLAALETIPKETVILGDGGAARGIASALAGAGAGVVLVSRRAAARRREFARLGLPVMGWDPLPLLERMQQADLLVQATSLGMHPNESQMPPLPLEGIHSGLRVVDLVYRPWETRFLREVRKRGAQAVNGWPMLVHQAAASLNLWTQSNIGQQLVRAASMIETRKP